MLGCWAGPGFEAHSSSAQCTCMYSQVAPPPRRATNQQGQVWSSALIKGKRRFMPKHPLCTATCIEDPLPCMCTGG